MIWHWITWDFQQTWYDQNIYRKSYMRHIWRHMWPPGKEIAPSSAGRILRGKRCIKMSLFLYGNSPEMRETEGYSAENLGMEMSWFLWGNSAEMRETEGNSAEKNRGMEMSLFLYGILPKWGNWGKIMYSNILIYVSLIGNGTWKNGCQQKIQAILEISGGGA